MQANVRISTHTSRVGCDVKEFGILQEQILISTHTSRVGCDINSLLRMFFNCVISTHTSRVGCDLNTKESVRTVTFLLTHPVWDVTKICHITIQSKRISTHTSRVGCDH